MTNPASPRNPGRPRGDSACRDRLLAAAKAAFAAGGYDGSGLREIARAAGCDVSMVAHYFGSKAELWRAIVDDAARRHEAGRDDIARYLGDPAATVEVRLRRGVALLFDLIAADVPLARLLMREMADEGERADYVEMRLTRPMLALFRPLWDEAVRAGIFGPVDGVVAHTAMVGAIAALVALRGSMARIGGRDMDVAQLRDAFCSGLFRRS